MTDPQVDIADHKQAEEALRTTELRLHNVIEHCPMGVLVYELRGDQELVLVRSNPMASRLLGLDLAVFVGKTIEKAFPVLAKTDVSDAFRQVARDGISWQVHDFRYPDSQFERTYDLCAFQSSRRRIAVFFTDVTDHRKAEEEIRRLNDCLERCVANRTAELNDTIQRLELEIAERKKAEEAVKESERRFRRLIENTADGIVLFSEEGRILDVSPGSTRTMKYTPEEAKDQTIFDVAHPDDHPRLREAMAECLRKPGVGIRIDVRVKDKHGSWHDLEAIHTNLLHDPSVCAIVSNYCDVTERKRLEEKMRESESLLRAAFDHAPFEFWVRDMEGCVVIQNAAVERHWGNQLGKRIENADVPSQVLATWLANNRRAFAGEVVKCEVEYPLAGEQHFYHNIVAPLRVGQTIRGILGFNIDITERKRAEEERDRFFNSSMDMLCVVGFDGYLKQLNPAWERTLGWSAAELLSRPWMELVHPEDRGRTAEVGRQVLAGQAARAFENRYLCKDGFYRWVSWNAYPILAEQRIFAVVRDITERKHAEEAAERHRAELAQVARLATAGELAAMIAHELKQPLFASLNYAESCLHVARSAEIRSDQLVDDLTKLIAQVERASGILQRLRELSRKRSPKVSPVDLNHLVGDVMVLAEPALRLAAVKVELRLSSGLFPIWAEGIEIEQVIHNMVRNAVEAMEQTPVRDRRLTIETRHTNVQAVELAISDTGPGIPADVRDRIFEPFWSTTSGGMGMGLAICRTIIEAHGGRLWLECPPEGGSVFCLSLPASGGGEAHDSTIG